jgi:hypothetical protein
VIVFPLVALTFLRSGEIEPEASAPVGSSVTVED